MIKQTKAAETPKKKTVVSEGDYAIIENGGKQYQVIPGKTVALEKIEGNIGDSVELSDILLRKIGDKVEIGQPHLEGSIKASIIRQDKESKVITFKFKRRKKSRVRKGHRQPFTVVRIESI